MDKLNDLYTDLNEEIDITNPESKKIKVSKLDDNIVIDLTNSLNEFIEVKGNEKIKVSKNKTKNFDSLSYTKNYENIDLVNPKKDFVYYNDKTKNFIKKWTKKYELRTKKGKQNNLLKNCFRILLFATFIIFIALFFKITIERAVTNGYENILALKNDFKDIEKAKDNINKARKDFLIAKILITPISFIPNNNIKNVSYLINGGNDISKLLQKSIDLYNHTNHLLVDNSGVLDIQFTKILEELRENYESIYNLLYSSLVNFNKIGDLGNKVLNEKIKYVNDKLKIGLLGMEVINNNYDTLLSILGSEKERKYLVVFQNNDEIRPTGGFMGSTALITIKNGKIENVDNSDIYALEWQINKNYTQKIPAPEGLNKITKNFGLRDANYFPEFRDSSKQIKFFLDMIPYDIDGIIYINQSIALDLLEKIGGVESKILEENITKDNFSLILSTLVEAKVFKVGTLGTPKQILFDFALEFYNKLISEKKYYDYANILLKHLKNRDIVFYSFNPEENSLLWKLGINGEVNFNEKLDFNYPVYTSIGGNKTDRYMEYRYDKYVYNIANSCDFETRLEIYNSQLFSKFEDQKVNELLDKHGITKKRDILNIQGRGDNKSYVRIFIPKEAIVDLSKNQKVIEEKNYKIIELYINTQKLETSKTIIKYSIPNPQCLKYTYKFFKEPGIQKYNINFDIFGEKNKYKSIESDFIYKRDEN